MDADTPTLANLGTCSTGRMIFATLEGSLEALSWAPHIIHRRRPRNRVPTLRLKSDPLPPLFWRKTCYQRMLSYQRSKNTNQNTFIINLSNLAMANYGYEEFASALPVQSVHLCVPLPHPDKQIRVLDLDPVHSELPPAAQALHGRLRILGEFTDYEYTALSYIWAQEDPSTSERENRLIIHCNDHLHEARLGPNCWSALWHLCKINRPLTLTIWVDSICIDQKNDKEKKQQISRMSSIYKSAQTTYFWLGEATKNTNEAMDFLSRDRITTNTCGVGNIFLIVLEILKYRITLRRYPHRSGLREIFDRQWIKRLWTLQECLLSRKGVIVCGEKSVPWAGFVCALESIHYFHTHPWSLHFDGSYLPWLNLANLTRWSVENASKSLGGFSENLTHPDSSVQAHLHTLERAVRISFMIFALSFADDNFQVLVFVALLYFVCFYIFPYGPKKARLFFPRTEHSILVELRNRDARDPKDMYNGMVGILGDDASDTGESLYTVYRRLCTSLICKTRSLDVLLFANTCADNNYCSWVINWNSTMPQLWGKAIYYMEKRKSTGAVPYAWNIESRTTSGLGVLSLFNPAQGIQCSTHLYPVIVY